MTYRYDVRTYIYIYIHTYVYIYVSANVYINIYIYTYFSIYIFLPLNTHSYPRVPKTKMIYFIISKASLNKIPIEWIRKGTVSGPGFSNISCIPAMTNHDIIIHRIHINIIKWISMIFHISIICKYKIHASASLRDLGSLGRLSFPSIMSDDI